MYCERFPGFFAYAKTLENLAKRIAEERTNQQNLALNAKSDTKSSNQKSKDTSTDSVPKDSAQSMVEL